VRRPGAVVGPHPDEPHDGHAAPADGFGYRIIYVAPARIAEAARAIRGCPSALPFAPEPVTVSAALASAIDDAFHLDPEPLATDSLVLALAEALLAADPSGVQSRSVDRVDVQGIARARPFPDAETDRVVLSSGLEAITRL